MTPKVDILSKHAHTSVSFPTFGACLHLRSPKNHHFLALESFHLVLDSGRMRHFFTLPFEDQTLVCLQLVQVILHNETFVNQECITPNFQNPNLVRNIGSQALLELDGLPLLIRMIAEITRVFGQLFKFGNILTNHHAPLLELQELSLPLDSNIVGKVFLQECDLEVLPNDKNLQGHHPLHRVFPPILCLVLQHGSQYNLKDVLHLFQPKLYS